MILWAARLPPWHALRNDSALLSLSASLRSSQNYHPHTVALKKTNLVNGDILFLSFMQNAWHCNVDNFHWSTYVETTSYGLQVYISSVVLIELNIKYLIFKSWENEAKRKDIGWFNRILKIFFRNFSQICLSVEYIIWCNYMCNVWPCVYR